MRLDVAGAKDVLKQVLLALDYLHSNGIVHRDLKLENLLVQQPGFKIKIADFGFADIIVSPDNKISGMNGSYGYVAPEVMTGGSYGFEVDIWSLGVVLYYLLTGEYPFKGRDINLLIE